MNVGLGGGYGFSLRRCVAACSGSVSSLHTFACVCPSYHVIFGGIDGLRIVSESGGGRRLGHSGGDFIVFVLVSVTRLFFLSSAFGGGLLIHKPWCVWAGSYTCVRA